MKQSLTKLVIAAVLSAGASMAQAQFCAGFTDVAAASGFCPNVEWLKNRSITLGGVCAAGTVYCPNDPVTRLQMAAFMNRMGKALTPDVLFVDQNPGAVTIQGGSYGFVCLSPPYPVSDFPRRAFARGVVWGIVSAPVTWMADVWYSTNGGATFSPIVFFVPQQDAIVGGTMTQGSTFAQMDLAVGSTYTFAILIRKSVDLTGGAGNFSDLACHLMVEIGNRNGTSSPFDAMEAEPAVRAGKLVGNVNAAQLPR
jgi:hypothetical protein